MQKIIRKRVAPNVLREISDSYTNCSKLHQSKSQYFKPNKENRKEIGKAFSPKQAKKPLRKSLTSCERKKTIQVAKNPDRHTSMGLMIINTNNNATNKRNNLPMLKSLTSSRMGDRKSVV